MSRALKPMAWVQTWTQALHTAWAERSPRERLLLGTAAWVLLLALTWQVAMAPALHTWREAPARQVALDAQTHQMQQLKAQALALQKTPATTRAEALRWLEANIPTGLGSDAQWRVQGDRLSVTLLSTPANQLTVWLRQAREQAQALPVQAQLQQVPTPPTAAKAPASGDSAVRWSGTLVLSLPGAP
ncbi:MAG: type II secretion system protein GspM [Pseudomonadota bacterium]|jgi:general secretion pathway protein M